MNTLQGRRRPDTRWDLLPEDIQPGDYWREVNDDGEPTVSNEPGNLTHGIWWVAAPMSTTSFALGRLTLHTVREETDGTISVRPGDGSSNSILIQKGQDGPSWHGYIEHGVWKQI